MIPTEIRNAIPRVFGFRKGKKKEDDNTGAPLVRDDAAACQAS